MTTPKQENDNTLTVGLGASAGGLDPLKEFIRSLPPKTGMAFIVIVHLSPDHESNLAELLQAHTALEVQQVTNRTEIKSDHVYVIPPDKLLRVGDNHLELSEPAKERQGLATIDLLFRSLANTKGRNAACIVLSGSGTDGSLGLKAVKEQGGLAIAQDPEEADYLSMPQSAINTGVVDLVLPVSTMAEELQEYQKNLSEIRIPPEGEQHELLRQIFDTLQSETGHDFSNYKQSSLLRRIERRMQVNRRPTLQSYRDYLQEYPGEAEELFRDLLISVTSFFRDPEAFEALGEHVIPTLYEEKGPNEQLRVWVPGCATGEEAYSIAILLHEYGRNTDLLPDIQIFASDIDEQALAHGRRGVYPESIAADIGEKRLARYFQIQGHQYRLTKQITDLVLFARHNLLRDPPFSNLDLIACRNLLIYLNAELQEEVFDLFQYGLRPGGWLFLGMSDSDLEASKLFTAEDKKYRIYRKGTTPNGAPTIPKLPLKFNREQLTPGKKTQKSARQISNIEHLHHNMLLRLYAPQSVIINGDYELIHATDGIQRYLEYGGGQPAHDVLEMVIPELRQTLRSLLLRAERKDAPSTQRKKALMGDEGEHKKIEIIVHRLSGANFPEGLLHVAFKEAREPQKTYVDDGRQLQSDDAETIAALEKELEATREQLQVTVEEYETSNEELRSSNEELQSMIEELQSTTEELETSQEELQSVNEELKSVNQKLKSKVKKLSRANSDLKNLMEATEVGILFVDRNFCVQRFTSSTTNIFNLISSVEGRPLAHVTHKMKYGSLQDDLTYVLDTLDKVKKIVSTEDERIFIMRMRPYRSVEDKIEGVVLTFTQLKEAEAQLHQQRQQESLATLGLYALGENDLEAIIHRALQQACLLLDVEYAMLFRWSAEDETLRLFDCTGCQPDEVQTKQIKVDDKSNISRALSTSKPQVVSNYEQVEQLELPPLLNQLDIASGVTMQVTESDQICGVLALYSQKTRHFSEEELNFVQIISNLIGMSSERAKAKQELEKTNRQLKEEVKRSEQYQKEILQNSLAERWNLGGYLHDNMAQLLVSVKIMVYDIGKQVEETDLDLSAQIDSIIEGIDEGIKGIRELTHEIIPIDIDNEGIERTYKLLIRQLQKTHNIGCRFECGEIIHEITDKELATNLYHIIQEAVKNAVVHGEAENIMIILTDDGEKLILKIIDDGKGLSSSEQEDGVSSGTNIMRHRIEIFGGTFSLEDISEGDKTGTCVTCTLPLKYLDTDYQ